MVKVWLKSHDMHFFSMESERNYIRKGYRVNPPYEPGEWKLCEVPPRNLSARDVLNNGRSWTTIKSRYLLLYLSRMKLYCLIRNSFVRSNLAVNLFEI